MGFLNFKEFNFIPAAGFTHRRFLFTATGMIERRYKVD